jgi:RNA-directed DNA polymerase
VKRTGNLWPAVIERGNLVRAFHQAARGKRRKQEVRRFAENLDENLDLLRRELIDRTFETGKFNVFTVYEPKERTIHAARFSERVFHHALMNLCEPVLERHSVFHSYACRKGKGRLQAIDAAQTAARRHGWQLKLDIRKYFESIPQERLISRLHRLLKDPEVLHWLEQILRGHRPDVGRGLPIGSLTSQHLANFYLSPLDRFCQSHPAVKAYVRYMDDFVCWGDDKTSMIRLGERIQSFVETELGLALKHPPSPQPTARGMDFLGYRIFPSHTELNRRSKVRYWRRIRLLEALHDGYKISSRAVQERLTALTAFVLPVCSHGFRQGVMKKLRSAAIGHEPGEPGRQLEQQREQLSRREPQQQQSGQHEQQHRVPGGSQLRPIRDLLSQGLNRPPSRSHPVPGCDKITNRPPGAGSLVDAGSNAPGGQSAFTMNRATGMSPLLLLIFGKAPFTFHPQ